VDESLDLPLSLLKPMEDLRPKPLNKDNLLSPLELPSETIVDFPAAIHVNATTGEIHTNTNEGKYPSPYDL